MKFLVTGATGFIGSTLAALLVSRGTKVRALVRRTSRREGLERIGTEMVVGDVTDPASLPAAVEGCDVVVHLAGLVKALGRRELFRVNVEGTRHLARACAEAARPPVLVLVSSLAAAGPSGPAHARTEEDAPEPVSLYGQSKLQAEEALRTFAGLQATVLRPPIVYGPGDKEVMPPLLRMARLGIILKAGFAEKRYCLVHVEDLCAGILAAAERGRRLGRSGSEGIYFLSDGDEHSWDDVGEAVCAALGRHGLVLPLPDVAGLPVALVSSVLAALTRRPAILSFDKMREMRQAAWTCSSARAQRELGWRPRFQLAEGIRQSVEWFREMGLA